MAKSLLLTGAVVALLIGLSACVDVAGIPSIGGSTAYERGLDQDVSSTFDEGPTTRNQSPLRPGNWR